jgi:hypothetical protein
MRTARTLVDARWATIAERRLLLPGKTVLSEISRWSQEHFGVALSAARLARELRSDEISSELRDVLAAIESGRPFDA